MMKALLLLFASALPAQFYVVDAAGGPGVQFSDIGAAVAAVPDGSVLLVRSGQYPGFGISAKSLTILAEPGTIVSTFFGTVGVVGLGAGQQVTIRGLELTNTVGGDAFDLRDNAGTVLLDSCRSTGAVGVGGKLHLVNCDDVRVHRCTFMPSQPTSCSCFDSALRISHSTLVSATATALLASNSTVELADTVVSGGSALWPLGAIDLAGGAVRVLPGTRVSGNSGIAFGGTGSVRLDPGVPVSGATSFGPAVTVSVQSMPMVAAQTAGSGGQATASMLGPVAGIGALFLGLPAPPTALPGLDPLLTLAGTENVLVLGALASPLTSGYAVPPLPLLLGVRVTWQGASIDTVNGLQIANGVTYVHY